MVGFEKKDIDKHDLEKYHFYYYVLLWFSKNSRQIIIEHCPIWMLITIKRFLKAPRFTKLGFPNMVYQINFSITVGTLLLRTHATHLMVTRDTHYHPDHPHPDFPKSAHGALLLSGLPQGEIHDTHKHNIRTTSTNASGRPT